MTKPTAKQKLAAEIATLQRKKMELEAQLASNYHFVQHGLKKADRNRTFGSGILVRLHYLGGAEVCPPFVALDGFSDATIAALNDEILYSHAKCLEFKPS